MDHISHIKRFLAVLSCSAILVTMGACGDSTIDAPSQTTTLQSPGVSTSIPVSDDVTMVDVEPKISEDGLVRVTIPENLLGGNSADKAYDLTDPEERDIFYEYFTDYTANEDGTATYVFTPEQFETYRSNMFKYGYMHVTLPDSAIKNVIYHDNMMYEITVYVDRAAYEAAGLDALLARQAANMSLAMYAGTYQVLSYIPMDEWHTKITVTDNDTGDIISETDFPNPNMYTVN